MLIGILISLVSLGAGCESDPLASGQDNKGVSMVVATTSDITVGPNRIAFSLFDFEGQVIVLDQAKVEATFYPPNENDGIVKDTSIGYWRTIPGTEDRGLYIADLSFDVPGAGTEDNPNYWEIISTFVYQDEELWSKAAIVVTEDSGITAIGEPVPSSVTLTASNLEDVRLISTAPDPDLDLYKLSIRDAIKNGKPTVIVFATPALCVSQVCGPIVDMIASIKNRFVNKVDFIHVEVFENPRDLIEQGRFTGEQVQAVTEWGLVTEP